MPIGVGLVAVLFALTSLGGCTQPSQHTGRVADAYVSPRLVLVYAPCTVSRLYMAPYNTQVAYTPNFDAFGKRASVFERHHTESGQSGIAYASLLSGGQADVHGVFKHPRRLREELILLPEVFEAAGYDTYSWMVQKMASSKLRYGQGVPDAHAFHDNHLEGDDPRFARILARLKEDPSYKAFVITNFTVTHGPYEGTLLDEFCTKYPAECSRRVGDVELERLKTLAREQHRPLSINYPNTVRELGLTEGDEAQLRDTNELLYKADMYRLDKLFGGVVDAVDTAGLFDDAVIAFTSDHGELLWRDNALLKWWHGYQLVPEVTNISLLVSGPGAGVPAARYAGVSRSIDVLPTLAGLADAALPKAYSGTGENLATALRGLEPAPDLVAFSHSALAYAPLAARRMELLSSHFPGPDPAYMWITARRDDDYYKFTRSPDDSWSYSLYDLTHDTGETNDSFDSANVDHAAMAERIEAYKEHMSAHAYRVVGRGLPRDKAIEMLRSLGYID